MWDNFVQILLAPLGWFATAYLSVVGGAGLLFVGLLAWIGSW